jgi:hypothetical protein
MFSLTVADIDSISCIAVEKGKGYASVRLSNVVLVLILNLQVDYRINFPSQPLMSR